MKILLVDPPVSPYAWNQTPAPPLGLLYLAAAVKNRWAGLAGSHDVQVLPLPLFRECPEQKLSSTLLDYEPDVVGFSVPTPSTPMVVSLSALAREISPQSKILLGGYQATIDSGTFLSQGLADMIVCGEGETPFCELLQALSVKAYSDLARIQGIAFLTPAGLVHINPPAPRLRYLDRLPFPARSLIPMESYRQASLYRAGEMIGSRGCPWECKFCYSPQLWGGAVYRSAPNILQEIEEMLDQYGLDSIRFGDDTFTTSRSRVLDFCNEIGRRGLAFQWEARTRIDLMDEELLYRMKETGLVRLQVGVETIQDASLQEMNKRCKFSAYERFFQVVNKVGVGVRVSVIIGLPNETPAEMLATLSWVENHLTEQDQFIRCMFTPYPGLPLNAKSWNTLSYDLAKYTMDIPLVTSHLFSYDELLCVKKKADALMYQYGPEESIRHPMPQGFPGSMVPNSAITQEKAG
ncbi:MAG: radical SAM protein [Chloroflexia bacterium]|nr:radical SAM protein [Chloroflexia bacterium]